MLQQKLKTNLNFGNQLSKCGEIHFLGNNLSLICIVCEVEAAPKFENYFEFKLHFEYLHLKDFVSNSGTKYAEDFTNVLEEQSLQSADNIETPQNDFIDPLILRRDHKQGSEKTVGETNKFISNELHVLTNNSANDLEPRAEEKEENMQLEIESDDNSDATSCNNSNVDDHTKAIIDWNIDWNRPYQPARNILKRPYKPRDKPNACTYCGRTFRRRYQLDTHINIHTGEKPHQCEICGRRFRAMTTLQRHLNTHDKRKVHVCQYCEKSFTHRAALLSHETRHSQTRTVSCDECEKKFYTINHCDTHKRRVHKKANTTLPFACNICSNRYRSASMLSTHKFRKHLKSAKFACEKCDKKFVDLEKLEAHQSIHVNRIEET